MVYPTWHPQEQDVRASVFSDPDDPIVPFLARLKTGDELDLLTMGVGLVVPQGQEIEVETQKVFFLSRSIKTAGKFKNYVSGPIRSLKLELSIVPNSDRLYLQISSQKLSESISDQRTA